MITQFDQAFEAEGRPHPRCWVGDHYEHNCLEPKGKRCVECGEVAGTPWGPYYCPDCDVVRLDKITKELLSISMLLRQNL